MPTTEERRSRFTGNALQQELDYWRERLAGAPPAAKLPTDRPRAIVRAFREGNETFLLSKELSDSLRKLSHEKEVTLFVTLLAGFQSLLFRYTAQDDIVVGCTPPEGSEPGTEGLIGPFADRLMIRTNLQGDPSFSELLQRVSTAVRSDYGHRGVPFGMVLKELQGDSNTNVLSRVLFSFVPGMSRPLQYGWEPVNLEVDGGSNCSELQVRLYEGYEGIAARFSYNLELFNPATIERMGGHFQTLLESIVESPDQCISRLPFLTAGERQLLYDWNKTRESYPETQCVHQLFEEQVRRTPDAIAVLFEDQRLTYAQLNSRANQVAHYLLELGVGPDTLIGICLERSPDLLIGLMGIMKAGAAYVPLDPQYPPSRLSLMVEDSGLKVLITQEPLRTKFPTYGGEVVLLGAPLIDERSAENCSGGANPKNLVYVIYTSGSTGKPKGVEICHRSLVNFLTSMRSRPGLSAQDILVAVTTVSFDIAALELYLPLIVGASVVLVSRDVAADGYKLREILENVAPTVMQATPATWRLLLEAGWKGDRKLKILCGGEAMPRELVAELLRRSSSVWNMYGPTETTVWSTVSQVTATDAPITIGTPIANTQVYVVDSHLEPLPVGVAGELYIGGDGVARGYLHRPDLTRERFICNPFCEQASGERLYRTGDLARYRADGQIECLGRIDNQVKVRGFRIELGEIESVLSEYPAIRQNVVVAREDMAGDKRLVAYIIPAEQQPSDVDELRKFLKQKLPDYMVPSQFVLVDAFPLTPNGKVDRKALPAQEQLESTDQKKYTAAGNSVEFQLLKIWASVLGVRSVGVTDNFFELGGHSLLVAKLLRHMEQTFGKKLSTAIIFEAPTIEQQASALRNQDAPLWPSALIPVQPSGSRPPFFWCGFGAGPVFLPLARRLGANQPLLGVDPTLLKMNELPVACDMGDIAACLIKQMRELYPEGPYYLGGFCGGGLVAYEVACQLVSQGQQVPLLALLEPHTAHGSHQVGHSNGIGPGWLKERLTFHIGNLRHILNSNDAQAYIRDHVRERSRVYFRSLERLFWNVVHDLQPHTRNGRVRNTRDAVDAAYRNYCPRPFSGQVALFQATHREPGGEWERHYWSELASSLHRHEIPGYSNWLVRFFVEPSVDILANTLIEYLTEVESRN